MNMPVTGCVKNINYHIEAKNKIREGISLKKIMKICHLGFYTVYKIKAEVNAERQANIDISEKTEQPLKDELMDMAS